MHVELDASGDKVPVPNGYVGSKVTGENEINTGYVIYEGEEEVNDTNKDESQRSRNQYVWIPVPDISKFYGTDANGKKWGKIYEFSSYTGSSYDEVTGTHPLNWRESNGIMELYEDTLDESYREPDILEINDYDSRLKMLEIGAKTTHEFLKQVETEFNNMLTSVEKYGGFYIGRYETGNISQNIPVIQKGNTDIDYQAWYNVYKRCKNIKGSNTNIETGLIWGSQWDRALMWLIESGNKTKEQIADDSTSWGNHYNATFEYLNRNGGIEIKNAYYPRWIPTGSTEYTKANNIYDLSGNIMEWTMETNDRKCKNQRGGSYIYQGDYNQASYRGSNDTTNSKMRLSFSTLY